MTVDMLAARGVRVDTRQNWWHVHPGRIHGGTIRIAPDLSNAAAFLVGGVVSRGRVRVPNWPTQTDQPGDQIAEILRRFGAATTLDAHGVLEAAWVGPLHGITLGLSDASELTPVVAALGACATGITKITGIGHIRRHETDRLAAIVTDLGLAGVTAEELPDGLLIHGIGDAEFKPGLLKAFGDHRIAQMAAILGLRAPGLRVDDIAATHKTMPEFAREWEQMADGMREVR
jgi:3-phosphoshikimate 1-carboxyvinyltransferase